jgi:L-idonate 5-dehydrogenase
VRAFVLHGARDLRAAELPVPVPGAGEVLLAVRRAGICGSDIHYYAHGRIGSFVPRHPFVPGHEFAGEIVAVGAGVPAGRIGARVAVDPSMPCGRCDLCRRGRYNLCAEMRFYGSASCDPHIDGGFEEFVRVPAANAQAVPDALGWGEAALAEPLSVALHALGRAGNVAGRAVLVTGGGTIGQLVALAARAFGAGVVVLSDIRPGPRRFALDRGADGALDAGSPDFLSDALAAAPGGFDVVVEAAGSAAALDQALAAARRGGTVVQVGTLPAAVTLPLNLVMARELTLAGSFRFANVFATALALMASGRIDTRPLVAAVYPLAETGAAIEAAMAGSDGIKVQIAP